MEKENNLKAAATAAVAEEDSSLAKTFKVVVHEEHEDGKDVTWKSFKDGLLLHRSGNTWAAAVAEGAAGRPRGGPLSRTASVRAPQKKLVYNGGFGGRNDEQDEAVAALLHQRPQAEAQPVKMSLMALLADSGGYSDDDEDDYEGEEDGAGHGDNYDGGEKEGDMAYECCVCMVRHKGAAFIPCGHTFCRLCSRELWVSRGNCPLCNGFILEILDIF